MNYSDPYLSYPDRTIAAAWDSQVKETNKIPWLASALTESGEELFTRFAACYAELGALPAARGGPSSAVARGVFGEAGTVSYSCKRSASSIISRRLHGNTFTNVGEQDIWIMIAA